MHCANNAVIMQTEQLGRIEALEEELQSSRVKMVEMEQKMTEQDQVIAQLVGDNLDYLQDNMWLTAHINSSQERMSQMEHRLGQVRLVVMGFLEGRLESLMEEEREEGTTELSSLSEARTSGASGNGPDDQGGDEDNMVVGVSPQESMRRDSPMLREEGFVEQAVVYSTLPQEYSTLTFRGEVVADGGGVGERSEVMYCIERDTYIYYKMHNSHSCIA